jgi:hypothetical protein
MTTAVTYKASQSFKDKENKVGSVDYNINAVDFGEFTADPVAGTSVVDALLAKTAALSKGFMTHVGVTAGVDTFPIVLPTADDAYRQSKLVVTSQDVGNGDFHTNEIPVRDITKFNTYPRTKDVILTVAAGGTTAIEDYITAFNACARSEATGNLLVVLEIKAEGRHL